MVAMIIDTHDTGKKTVFITALTIGALWGIFESTLGYLLHLLPVNLGFLVWYPIACYFLTKAYRESGRASAVLLTAMFASLIKLFNLILPGRIDQVLNPAVSIIFEGIAVWAAVFIFHRMHARMKNSRWLTAALALGANSLWRVLFALYLAVAVPGWVRDISVIRSVDTFLHFMIVDNLAGGVVAWLGFQALKRAKDKLKPGTPIFNVPAAGRMAGLLIASAIGLQLLLR